MRSLKVDGKYVIRNSSYEGVLGVPHCSEEEFFSKVEELYRRYKHSIPSERSEYIAPLFHGITGKRIE